MVQKDLKYFVVDAFTRQAFSGNPAAVVFLSKEEDLALDDAVRQKIASEFNLAETAFLVELEDSNSSRVHYSLRWFTPTQEVPLCGHATLAPSFIIFKSLYPTSTSIVFETKFSGQLLISRKDSSSKLIQLDFPKGWWKPLDSKEEEEELIKTIGKISKGGEWEGKVVNLTNTNLRWTAELEPDTKIEGVEVDQGLLAKIGSLIVTAPSSSKEVHFKSRLFGPIFGIPEDPVTGAAHTILAPYYLSRANSLLSPAIEGKIVIAHQVSPRGGVLECEWDGGERVLLRGEAVQVCEGILSFSL